MKLSRRLVNMFILNGSQKGASHKDATLYKLIGVTAAAFVVLRILPRFFKSS